MQCSLCYAAPEVLHSYASKRRIAAQPAADVWALGVLVYEALTSTSVFAPFGVKRDDIFAAAAGDMAYPWEAMPNAAFSQSKLRKLVEACVSRDPKLRPSAAQVTSQLDLLGQG